MNNAILACSSYRFHNRLLNQNVSLLGGECKGELESKASIKVQCVPRSGPRRRSVMVKAIGTPLTISSRVHSDIPFDEAPEASFDEYMEDKQRLFEALFPQKQASERLTEEEWRVHMFPMDFLFLSAYPVIDMRLRCKSNGLEYPPDIPQDTLKVLELDIIRWELRGLADVLQPSHFSLSVKGSVYPDRHGLKSRLKGQLQITTGFSPPPVFALVPDHVHREVGGTLLRRLSESMKQEVFVSLLADYNAFKGEKLKSLSMKNEQQQ